MVFKLIYESVKVLFCFWLASVLLVFILTPSMGIWGFVLGMEVAQVDDSAYHVYALSAVALYLHVFIILYGGSEFRSWGGLKYLAASSFLMSFFFYFGTSYLTSVFIDEPLYSILQNIAVFTVTHVIPFAIITDLDEVDIEDEDEELTYSEDSVEEGNEEDESMKEFEEWMRENSQVDKIDR